MVRDVDRGDAFFVGRRFALAGDAALARAGKVFAIVRLMSPQPKVLQASMALYMATTTDPDSPLPRWFRELIAVTVSRTNHCVY